GQGDHRQGDERPAEGEQTAHRVSPRSERKGRGMPGRNDPASRTAADYSEGRRAGVDESARGRGSGNWRREGECEACAPPRSPALKGTGLKKESLLKQAPLEAASAVLGTRIR